MKLNPFYRIVSGILMAPTISLCAAFSFFDPIDTARVPKTLSKTGIYNSTITKSIDSTARYFQVNAALWSDGAAKNRWVILPKGKHIPYNDSTDFFEYPDSTVFIKTFQLDKIQGDSTPNTSRIYWETRLLMKRADGSINSWFGFSYRWRADQSDADLVSIADGFDTLFYFTNSRGKRTYKKWHFPSQLDCTRCHVSGTGIDPFGGNLPYSGRAVLGFYPAQLKMNSPSMTGTNQVLDLFDKGVFSGSRPIASSLARHFKGVREPLANSLTSDERFAAVDTIARSYLAANCSGCHGFRGMAMSATGQALINFDFYDNKPHMEYGMAEVNEVGLNNTASFDTAGFSPPAGRNLVQQAAAEWGVGTGPGEVMDLTLPKGNPADLPSVMVYPGYPSMSEILYRQWARNTPSMDSGNVSRTLKFNRKFGDSAAAKSMQAWLFSMPWGSQAWIETIKAHGMTVDKILKSASGPNLFDWHGDQMPILATYEPDTSAIKVLAEWVKNYKILYQVGIRPKITEARHLQGSVPYVLGNVLYIPGGWQGETSFFDTRGRSYGLTPIRNGAYALPVGIKAGIYLAKVGTRSFLASVF